MAATKIHFNNRQGDQLTGRLELPVNQKPHSFAIFAHCFTCTKNLMAVRNISRMLHLAGIGVLRFDFTGLGESEGDFADTNFSSNVEDLIAAADFLTENYESPALLVGHSLGGAAVVAASKQLDKVKAIATIGAPFDPSHVQHLLGQDLDKIEKNGVAEVNIGGRPFKVKKQFLEDIQEQNLKDILKNSRKALLIMHSPQDRIVEIENAKKIYVAAFHPKSFISLDGADHLLSNKVDSQYAGEMIATWAKKYILDQKEKSDTLRVEKQVAVRLGDTGYTTEIMARHHSLNADEPESIGGNDFGPSPYELVTAGLGACTAMTLQMYARRKKWPLQEVVVHLEHYKDYAEDFSNPEDPKSKLDHFERYIIVKGDLDKEQRKRLLEIAERCPVHRTLKSDIKIITKMKDTRE